MTTSGPETRPPVPRRQRRLLRSREDRIFGGVAGGLADYFDVDPVIFRVGFGIGALISGLGILAYLALLIAVPNDDGSGRPAQNTGWGRVAIGSAAILLAVLVLSGGAWGLGWWLPRLLFWLALAAGAGYLIYRWLSRDEGDGPPPEPPASGAGATPADRTAAGPGETAETAVMSAGGETAETSVMPAADDAPPPAGAPPTRPRGSAVATGLRVLAWTVAGALALGAAALLMLGSAWVAAEGAGATVAALVCLLGLVLVGGALAGAPGTRWLVVPALLLALPLGVVSAADIELRGGYGDQAHRPSSPAAIPGEGYEMAAGEMTVDLRAIDWKPGDRVELPIYLGLGEANVIVPDRVCVESRADVTAGMIDVRGSESWGVGIDPETLPIQSPAPRLLLGADVESGYLEVLDQSEYERRGFNLDGDRREWDDEDRGDDEAQMARATAACHRLAPPRPGPDAGKRGGERRAS